MIQISSLALVRNITDHDAGDSEPEYRKAKLIEMSGKANLVSDQRFDLEYDLIMYQKRRRMSKEKENLLQCGFFGGNRCLKVPFNGCQNLNFPECYDMP
jgi:hypothetical protein